MQTVAHPEEPVSSDDEKCVEDHQQLCNLLSLECDPSYLTAAIGDGGNDVSMLQEAHIGLGIIGHEGTAAAQASDFAFTKFKFLKRALLDFFI